MAKNANTAGKGGLFGGSSAKSVGFSAIATFSSFAAQRGINKLSEYYEATGDTRTAKTLENAGNITKNVTGGAAAGAMIGSVITPGLGTAVGAGVGAAVGAVGSAFEYLADKAREAAESLEKIADWRNKMNDVVSSNQYRNEMKVAKGGDTVDRTNVYKIN